MAEEGTGKIGGFMKDIAGKISSRELDYYNDIDRAYGRKTDFNYDDVTSSWANAKARDLKELGYTDAEIAACTPGELAYFYATDNKNLPPTSSIVGDILEDMNAEAKKNGMPASMEDCPSAVGAYNEFSKSSPSGHGFNADKFTKDGAFVDTSTVGMSVKELTQYGPGTPGNFPGATTGMSFKEATQYGPGTGSMPTGTAGMSFKEATQYGPSTGSISSTAAAAAVSAPTVDAPAPTTPSIASTLDVHGVAAPSAGLTGTVSVGGVAHSNFGSVSFSSVGIGTPVGAAPTSNFATPSLAAAMEMHAQQAAAAAAAAARHEAFVAHTAMEADMLNNQQHAQNITKEAMVDRWTAAADFYGSVPAAAMTGPQVFDPYSGGMVSAPAGDLDLSPGGAGWGGFATTSWSDFCAAQGLSVTSGLSLDADNIGSLSGDFTGPGGFSYSEGTASFSGGWSDSLTDAAPGSGPSSAPGADANDTGGNGYGGGYDGGYGGVAGGDNIGDSDDSGSDHASNDSGGGGYSGGGAGGAGYGGEDRDNFSGGYGGGYGSSTAESSSSSSSESSSSSSSSESSSGSSGSNSGGVGGGAGSASEGSGSFAPVVLDLDGDGVELVDASAGAQYDTNDDGTRERLGWAGKDDGLLAIDLDGDGKITGAKELSFAMHTAEEGDTDLEGLAKVFDSNKDGVLDANDSEFAKFRIWQDKDGDGISDAGEVKTLTEMGIKSIGVVSDGKAYIDAGNTVHGTASYTKTDGTTRSVGDVDFKIAGKGDKPTAIDDEDGDDEDASFDRNAKNALSGKIPTRLPEMSTSGGAIAMAA